jgi:hypothetical protein
MLGREHRECSNARKKIQLLVRETALAGGNASDFAAAYRAACEANGRRVVDTAPALGAWKNAVANVLDDRILSAEEEQRLLTIAGEVGIDQGNGGTEWLRMVKAAILREATEGKIPQRAQITGYHANLMKKEKPVWLFNGCKFLEERTSRSFSGVSHGLSIKVMKGVYYRPSLFRGHPVETSKVVHVDNGSVLVTSHHIYLLGARKSSRIPYRKIIAFEPYSDGVGVQRDTMTAKPQIFTVDDAWFAYNLVTNLAQVGADQ